MRMQLTEKDLFDYIRCPVRYDAIHNRHLISGQEESVTTLLEKATRSFFLQLMNGTVMSEGNLKKKWDRLCEGSRDYMTPQRSLEGLDKLMRMYRWAADEELMIGDVSIPYELAFQSERCGVFDFRGEIACIAMGHHAKTPCLLYLDYSNRYPDQAILDMKLKYTLDAYAARVMTGKKLGTKIHHVKSSKDYYTMREALDFGRMKAVIRNVADSIQAKLFYPRENVMCRECDMLSFCRIWKG